MMERWSGTLNLGRIQQRYGTPLYIFHPEQLIGNIISFTKVVREPANIAFPVKACPCAPVLQIISQYGLSIDCASPTEVTMALEAGVPYPRILYNSPDLCVEVAQTLLHAGGTLVLNDVEQLVSLPGPTQKSPGRVFLRWNPASEAESHRYDTNLTAHGRRSSQFGSSREAILALGPAELKRIDGLHTHIGSRIKSLGLFTDAVNQLHELVDAIYHLSGHRISALNLGGGLKLAMNDEDSCPAIDEYVTTLTKVLRREFNYTIEPGNALTGNTMGLLTSITSMKRRSDGGCFAIVDVGSNQLLKYTFSEISPSVLTKDGHRLSGQGPDALAGPLCFAGDVILPGTQLSTLSPGDPLFIQHCGAYCMSLSHQFNGRYRPAVLTVNEDGDEFISQIAEDMWITAPTSAGMPWQSDRSDKYSHNNISIPETQCYPAKVLSACRTGERSYLFHLNCHQIPDTMQKLSIIFGLARTVIHELHPGTRLSEPDRLVLLSQQHNFFKTDKSLTLFISAGTPSSQGIRISFGNQNTLLGYYCVRMVS
ncbi:TPA: hypothetical protein JG914_004747 [Enterobacter hormaechei subsp. steigerwaltii]|nr:hypothetical protein [Enterobacter hormaechei subsp. steigerwaltii]